jgi:hypothetical protein
LRMNGVRQADFLDNRVFPDDGLNLVLWPPNIKLTLIIVPAGHHTHKFIDIVQCHVRNDWLDQMRIFFLHFSSFG